MTTRRQKRSRSHDAAIENAERIRLSLADQLCFAEALCSPPPANTALKRAFEKRGAILATE